MCNATVHTIVALLFDKVSDYPETLNYSILIIRVAFNHTVFTVVCILCVFSMPGMFATSVSAILKQQYGNCVSPSPSLNNKIAACFTYLLYILKDDHLNVKSYLTAQIINHH